ncbi:MAG: hypothetical protein QNK05_02180 [Myxococcota bacterium]|nr:hypothetical protein [Myxococcota bacterium]
MTTASYDAQEAAGARPAAPFFVYVEGPRDGDILRGWARQLSRELARRLGERLVILGGRQPARAVSHLDEQLAAGRPARGLCVLDRDVSAGPIEAPGAEVGLEIHVWERRHIEAYLLEPDVIRRALRITDRRLTRKLDELLTVEGARHRDSAPRFDAKRLLHRNGPIARLSGRAVDPGSIARAMREDEIAPEVRGLLARIGTGLGIPPREVVIRNGSS